jgi:hypothetical protein
MAEAEPDRAVIKSKPFKDNNTVKIKRLTIKKNKCYY